MTSASVYHPIPFYLITVGIALVLVPIASYLSARGLFGVLQPVALLYLASPCITALAMIYLSGNKELIQAFQARLFLFTIRSGYLMVILFLMPCVILAATALSLLFGYSPEQFLLAKELSVMKGWAVLGIFIPLLLAPMLEELGWRGYGVDSLRAYFTLFTTSLIFGLLWAVWHLPAFFVKGYYQNQLWSLGAIYVVNFFLSVVVVAFLMNWIYFKTGRSIPALILFHAMLNLSSILFRTEPFTKCIATVLLLIVLVVVIVQDRDFFFGGPKNVVPQPAGLAKQPIEQRLHDELERFRQKYRFPGATAAYVLADGERGSCAVGLADRETGQLMTPLCRMLAASIGKSFVAATVLALAHEHRLSLDDPLAKWLGHCGWYTRLPNHETITLRHLLTHSAGLPDHTTTPQFVELFAPEGATVSPELLIGCIFDHSPLFAAGEGWHYTDTGYVLLGLVIETATGNRYYAEVDQRLLQPLGLHNTSPSNQKRLPGLVAGYTPENNAFGLPKKTVDEEGSMVWNPAVEWTGGGLISNSQDLACWAKLLYEGKALPFDYLDDLLRAVPTGDESATTFYGLAQVYLSKCDFIVKAR